MPSTVRLSARGEELGPLLDAVRTWPAGPVLLGIAGAPGAGKTTLAAAIAERYDGVQVPMDGFHLADAELERRGLRSAKGAPETFDAWGYAALLRRLRDHPEHDVMAPAFDHTAGQPIAGSIAVPPEASLVVTEGNYLLLDSEPWRTARAQLHAVWHVTAPEHRRVLHLVRRHTDAGMGRVEAMHWVARVDRPNGELADRAAPRADLILDLTDWTGTLR